MLDANVRAVDAPFQEGPEIFQCVRVDLAIHLLPSMVDHLMYEIASKAFVGLQGIAYSDGGCVFAPSVCALLRVVVSGFGAGCLRICSKYCCTYC